MAAPNVKIRADGRADLTWGDVAVAVEGLGPQVTYVSGGTTVTWRPRRLVRDGDTMTAERGGLALVLRGEAVDDGVVLSAVVRNDGHEPVEVVSLAPLAVGPDGRTVVGPGTGSWSVYRNGFQSWSGTGSFRRGDRDREPPIEILSMTAVNAAHPALPAWCLPLRAGHGDLLGCRGPGAVPGIPRRDADVRRLRHHMWAVARGRM